MRSHMAFMVTFWLLSACTANSAISIATMPSSDHISSDYKLSILKIVREYYADFGPKFAQEKQLEQHHLPISKETLRQWVIADGFCMPHSQRKPRVYQPRYHRNCQSELVQSHGSLHTTI